MSKPYLVIDVSDLPKVERRDERSVVAGGWVFDITDPPTTDDVLALAAVVRWFEQHPEVVPDGD